MIHHIKDILHPIATARQHGRWLLTLSFVIFHLSFSVAQIKVGGNVYGGGNEGYVGGSTKVTVRSGDLNKVFGGARMANVGGNAYVNVDGKNASGYMVINYVFGGNDIAGTIGTAKDVGESVPSELVDADLAESSSNGVSGYWKADRRVDDTWNTYVHISSKTESDGTVSSDNKKVFIGQVYAGGNGDYSYTPASDDTEAGYNVREEGSSGDIATLPHDFDMPHLDKTFLDVQGGTVAFAYGGGNAVTVREKTVIHVDNPSKVITGIKVDADGKENDNGSELLTTERIKQSMGINMTQEHVSSAEFQIGRFFGGNNKAEMAIQPTWNLQRGKIRNLYSGGNEGNMTHPVGLLLDIDPFEKYKDLLVINNVYGGCRKADVRPTKSDNTAPEPWEIQLPSDLKNKSDGPYRFPAGLPARTLVRGGLVTNVYGGNDVSGHVYGGNAVGIYTSILGDVYGGGNGSYAYTDKEELGKQDEYKDFYYDSDAVLQKEGVGGVLENDKSVTALNLFRPNAEQVSLRLWGKSAANPTIIGGSVFVGGNSATLTSSKTNPLVELKIGSHVYADKVFLGNNGENMVNTDEEVKDGDVVTKEAGVLRTMRDINSIDLTAPDLFAKYMDGCAMTISPRVVFDAEINGDPQTYIPYSSFFGSFYCGGNVGSMKFHGCTTIDIVEKAIIFDKLVGGSNKADVKETQGINAAYSGGLLLEPDENGDKLVLNLSGVKLQPKRWKDPNDKSKLLEWNTWLNGAECEPPTVTGASTDDDLDRRLVGANVYGGCCESGHVEGNVVININGSIVDREGEYGVFDTATPTDGDPDILYDHTDYTISERRSGVILDKQGMDVLGDALTVFGGGKGKDTEIWGSATVNINKGYCFQVFGGSKSGVIGKPIDTTDAEDGTYTPSASEYTASTYAFNGKLYSFLPRDPKYSTYVNLNYHNDQNSDSRGKPRDGNQQDDMADVEFIYGGSFEGPVIGNTIARLDNGRLFNLFAGSCNADILGHTETYVGENGFPWLRDHIYGGNDLGGEVKGVSNFTGRLRDGTLSMVHDASMLQANCYVEYRKGRTKSIFGGCFGDYDYKTEFKEIDGYSIPRLHNAFVNIRPDYHSGNTIEKVFGAGEGCPGIREGDKSQDCSYVLIDIDDTDTSFQNIEVFGAGSNNGLGMIFDPDETFATDFGNKATAVIDLLHGTINNVYGGSYNEGVTRRTMVNVPAASTIKLQNIFGGAYGTQILPPCDVYESNVNYNNISENARLTGAIYGGNNNQRRTLFTHVNIASPVWQSDEKNYTATVFGAGRGANTWSEYTEVNLESGARVYKAFGGGEEGHVLNATSVQSYMKLFEDEPSPEILAEDPQWGERYESWEAAWKDAWTLGYYYTPDGSWEDYAGNAKTNRSRLSDRPELSDQIAGQLDGAKKHNTSVIIKEGAVVDGYAYGGGLGNADLPLSGDVYGSTYVALLGGTVNRDIYAAGQTGGLDNQFGATGSTNLPPATANAYIQGGMVRNVYGGGYEGHVGHHDGDLTASTTGDRLAKSYVVIGNKTGETFTDGVPAIMRNAYGGGEGGSVYGDTKVTLNNGYIGYRYKNTGTEQNPVYEYVEELDDQKPNAIELAGNVFGGGYVVNSYVDNAQIDIYGGIVRGSVYGGGEVGPIGRGTMKSGTYTGAITNGDATIFKGGKTQVNMYDGHVLRNVFGGGRGHDSWGGDGTMYMKPEVVAQLDMKCKGYVFGQTEVNIHGGEIGTAEGMERGFGNVFGGCDEGSVYSATGQKSKTDEEGYYYNGDNLTEDCKVVVAPYAKALGSVSVNSHNYAEGDYVPINDLNTLKGKDEDTRWANIDPTGIIIHNAVFAGGNLAPGSNSVNANETTVFGNATATIHDVYNRDLITIGTGHTGGLYGDGNLTMVGGYRELNITNYGTDYYHIARELTYNEYTKLDEREKAYYELKYKCKYDCSDIEGTSYTAGSELPQDELLALFQTENGTPLKVNDLDAIVTVGGNKTPNPEVWTENGVVSVYAGRIMNTIQRADFCGVFGSRMVMKGARDRVPEEVDYTNYTINRVREVSLNKVNSPAGDTDDTNKMHGNYFGIYNTVNFLGALTSDVRFDDVRTTKAGDGSLAANGTTTFYQWKSTNIGNKTRNNGSCHNQLALASGVSLELTTEKSTGKTLNEKDWGLITGVVELDLINVQPGIGGGFVYAKNQHGEPTKLRNTNTTLTALNNGAVTQWDYEYATPDANRKEWQTSGNFVHYSQTILDDCYNISNKYKEADGVPAHYWYIAGSVYVYDQYISAYTGSPNAFRETAELPIVISAAANGKMTLMDVRPSLYAYYASYTSDTQNVKLGDNQKMVIGDVTYQLNDPINYWDWYKLSTAEKKRFVSETYVLKDSCKIGDNFYPAGYVMLPKEYTTLTRSADSVDLTPTDEDHNTVPAVLRATVDANGNPVVVKDNNNNDVYVAVADAFRSSNNMSHNTGYLLTYDVTNPKIWGQWYTPKTGTDKNQEGGADYEDAPTYRLKSTITDGKVLGQREYAIGGIIPQKVYQDYQAITNKPSENQATFVPAYIVTKEYTGTDKHYYPGAAVKEAISGYTAQAYVCTSTIKLSDTEYIYVNDLMSADDISTYKTKYPSKASDINSLIVPAYYCSVAGLYGGNYYSAGNNYRALEAWSSMSEADRENFTFNYDALDLLIDPTYGKQPEPDGTQQAQGQKYQYDSAEATKAGADANAAHYSLPTPIDYTATYNGTTDETPHNDITLTNGDEYSRIEYELLPNEQRHYAAINVDKAGDYYVVNTDFIHVETPYAVGTTLSSEAYGSLTETEKANITTLHFEASEVKKDGDSKVIPYYYCRENYVVGEKGEGKDVTSVKGVGSGTTYTASTTGGVPVGAVISGTEYASLPNYQKNFTIHGQSPMETSTLYVSRNSDIFDLSKEKIITVIYKYDYEESDADGMHITPVSERHVVNIHIKFESGVPIVPDIQEPDIVLPGTSVIMPTPLPTPGAYEITGGGWELYEKTGDAESHTNGMPFTPSETPLYWYQDEFYLAYYAKTYLGKTYSNYVPVHVANYHDLADVMADRNKEHHMYIDNPGVKRDSKIYINDYSASGKNGLDLFKDLYDLSLQPSVATSGPTKGHALLNSHVRAGRNLEFFLRTDIDRPSTAENPWISIGYDDTSDDPATPTDEGLTGQCFDGVLHGDGHTISGLNNSLFDHLCGEVYNLGVTGSFTGGGVVDTGDGYVESCWVKTTGTPATGTKAVFGDPTATSGQQVVNCYYPESNSGYADGPATKMPDRAFYNGEVAYDLNNFYLYKRYSDKMVAAPTGSDKKVGYRYFTIGDDNKPALQPMKYYGSNPDLCSSGYIDGNDNGLAYVEDRFEDGDFRYAAGEIPTSQDERRWVDPDDNQEYFFPIWPDDYLFFGQKLTYGYSETQPHQEVPTAVVKSSGRLSQDADANRVYRAPAYFRSSKMGVAHFNPYAFFAQTKKNDADTQAYPGMTAIDFTGSNGDVAHVYQKGYDASTPYANITGGAFYPPLLDDDGLTGFLNVDQTRNMLVYTAATGANTTAAEKTATVVSNYLKEPVYTESTEGYRKVAQKSSSDIHSIHGHWVENETATRDHLLVDKEDFNAPISYTFAADKRMWYQRTPDNFAVQRTENGTTVSAGWEGISLPFSAELVTTNQKGEITHFYEGSETSKNGTGTKISHEYWLRRLVDGSTMTQKTGNESVLVATFTYPSATDGSVLFSKTGDNAVTNTFLWDYYYQGEHSQKDKNADIYQEYYSKSRDYVNYPLLTNGTPYLIGLPGKTYYEFDLSGEWEALTTGVTKPTKLNKQTITFASVPGTTIQVSDNEMGGTSAQDENSKPYVFKPNYLNSPDLETGKHAFLLNNDGNSFVEDNTAITAAAVTAFRPFFTAVPASPSRELTRSIMFLGEGKIGQHEGNEFDDLGAISARAEKHKIVVSSTRKYITDVRIVNAAGQVIATMAIKPGETIETRIINGGVYIVQDENGEYIKKLLVK